jgi:3-deoxy-D-manno-octulosonic-acid transferase
MRYILDAIYLFLAIVSSPFLIYKALTTGKYRRGMWGRVRGAGAFGLPLNGPRVWFHGVSVGEIHLLRTVVAAYRARHPDVDCVISATTDTGFDEARKWFPDLTVIRFPLDFSWAVDRALREVDPQFVVLAESELWPNFLLAARRRCIRVTVINARMSPRSFRRWVRVRPIAKHLFGLIDQFAVQTMEYAENLRRLGVLPERLTVTGSVKYDGVLGDRRNPRTAALRDLLDVRSDDFVWIAGSTQAPEEEVALAVYAKLRAEFPQLRLVLVPRQKERFDEVANLLERSNVSFVRRSRMNGPMTGRQAVVLVDTFGELGALWGLADIAFVGGSLDGKRGGQNMIEPAAFGAAVLFGPHVWNFRDAVRRLLDAAAAIQVRDAAELEEVVRRLLADARERRRLGDAARELVRRQQGVTGRTIEVLDGMRSTIQFAKAS